MEVNRQLSENARNDLILVEEAKKGNEKAFAALMNRYRDSIYFMLLKMVNNPSDAEDLTIEAFGKAFRSIDTYVPRFAFSTWLFMIASNNCIDFIRKNRHHRFRSTSGRMALKILLSTSSLTCPIPRKPLLQTRK